MKCNSCGGEYATKELKCPYCGAKNSIGEEWLKEEENAKKHSKETLQRIIASTPFYVFNRVLTAILMVGAVLAVILFLVLMIAFKGEDLISNHKIKTADWEYVEGLYQDGKIIELEEYMDAHDLWYAEGVKKYVDLISLVHDEEDFNHYLLYYFDRKDDVEYMETHSTYGPVYTLFERCEDIVQMAGAYSYKPVLEENMFYYEQLRDKAIAVLMGEFELTEDDITYLQDNIIYSDERDVYIRKIYERKGWEYGKDK